MDYSRHARPAHELEMRFVGFARLHASVHRKGKWQDEFVAFGEGINVRRVELNRFLSDVCASDADDTDT